MRISDWSSDVCSSDLSKRGFLAANWPLMTAAGVLMAGGIAMGMAVGSTGPKAQPATVVAAVTPLPAQPVPAAALASTQRSEEHTSELQSLMRISYAVFCLKNKKHSRLS